MAKKTKKKPLPGFVTCEDCREDHAEGYPCATPECQSNPERDCAQCGKPIVGGTCHNADCVNNAEPSTDDDHHQSLEAQRYRLTLEKALKRVPAQIKNLIVADLQVILDEFDKTQPVKLIIPMMAHLEWNGEQFVLESCITVKRLPKKFEHGTETIDLATMLPGMEDLEFGED